MTNTVSAVQNSQPVFSLEKNRNVLSSGMKLIDLYKAPHLFEAFRAADIDEDGEISDSEIELYDTKENLKKEAFAKSRSCNKLTPEHGYWALGFAGVIGLAVLTSGVTFMAVPLALGAMIAFGGFMSVTAKQNKKADKYVKQAFEDCKKLDEEYRLKLAQKDATNSK